jgi:signal transduction histidine kinase
VHEAIYDALPDPVLLVRGGVVRSANRAFLSLLGDASVVDVPLIELAPECPVDLLRRLSDESGDESSAIYGARVVFHGRSPSRPRLALDIRIVHAGDEGWVLVGQDATEVADLHATIGLLSRLYVMRKSAAMVDVDLLLAESRPIFEGLGWNLGLWAIETEGEELGARLHYSFVAGGSEREVSLTSEVIATIQGRFIPLTQLTNIRRVVEDGHGVYVDDLAPVGATLVGRAGSAAGAIEERLRAAGLVRAALAPVFVDERVAFVLMFSGTRITERDFAAIQLFAAMVSAAEQLGTLSEEMARQDRHAALGQMAAQLAHEVRNPLAVLYQATSQIRHRQRDGRDITELVAMIDEESRRLDRLVNDLVHFAAPLAPRIRETSLEPIVRYALDGVRAELGEERFASLAVQVAIDDVLVQADPVLLRQALAHLFHNAVGYAGKGGLVEVRAELEGPWVRLRVRNDGAPLTPDVASRVFEPFFSTKAQGSGLGLAVVRRLVEDQGGKVLLEEHHAGVSFAVLLRAVPRESDKRPS